MANLKDQIQEKIRRERQRSEKPAQAGNKDADESRNRLDEIRPKLDELSHATDRYRVRVDYVKGPYSADVAVVELDDMNGTWVAAWQIARMVDGSVPDREVTYNPHGVETQRQWFRNSDDLFSYLAASIAERIVEMEAAE